MKLGELVDHMFPPVSYLSLHISETSKVEYNDFNYWKIPIAQVESNGEFMDGVILPNELNKSSKK